MVTKIVEVRSKCLTLLGKASWFPPLLGRVAVGWVFLESGWGKLHNLPQVVEYFTELGIPAPHLQAPFVAGTEFVCGFLVLVGLFTRLAAIPLIGTMVVAIATALWSKVDSASDLFGLSEFLYIVVLVFIIFGGPGRVALDTFVWPLITKNKA